MELDSGNWKMVTSLAVTLKRRRRGWWGGGGGWSDVTGGDLETEEVMGYGGVGGLPY